MTNNCAKLTVRFNQPVTVFALVIGGWYPLAFAPNCILLLDRNILGILDQLDQTSGRNDLAARLDFLNNESHTLNPVLCALEGEKRSVPSKSEFTSSFQAARDKIRKYLPKARSVDFANAHFNAAYETLSQLSARYESESAFLISVAPIISQRRKDSDLESAQAEIFALCEKYRLSKNSLAVVAVLSCLYESKDGSEPMIGRHVVKPGDDYSQEDAHNAISDIRALEMLAATNGLNMGCASLCTRDKYLAAMWCGLKISEPYWTGDTFTCSMSPNCTLFPRLSAPKIQILVGKLNAV